MRRFKRKTENNQDYNAIGNLVPLLKQHGDSILNGRVTLSLTTPVVASLNKLFQSLTDGTSLPTFQVSPGKDRDANVAFVFDFIQKAVSVKIVCGPILVQSPLLDVKYFKALQSLEIRKVPIGYVKGLSLIRRQLCSLVCCRSTSSLESVVKCFAKDDSGPYTLPELTSLDVSYNTISRADDSLSLLPELQSLNLSHNCIHQLDPKSFPTVSYLNIGYNALVGVPTFPSKVASSLTHLVLRNNNLSSLDGCQFVVHLKTLDASANCISKFADLIPLATLHFLTRVVLKGNPISYANDYRNEAISRLSPMVRQEQVFLDEKILDHHEILCLGKLVEPVSLRAYIPDEPLGRPSGSLTKLADSLSRLSVNPRDASTSQDPKPGKKSHRRVRDALIADPSSLPSRRSSFTKSVASRLMGESKTKGTSSRTSSRTNSRSSSKRGSVGDRSPSQSSEEMKADTPLKREWSSMDYATFPGNTPVSPDGTASEPANFRYNEPPVVSNDVSNDGFIQVSPGEDRRDVTDGTAACECSHSTDDESTEDEASVVDEHEDSDELEVVYLVERVLDGVAGGDEQQDNESIFVIIRGSVLIEKETIKAKIVEQLDLNYLISCTSSTVQFNVELRFDLLKTDRRKRVYAFDSEENMKAFKELLAPLLFANQSRQMDALQKHQCLKCSMVFPSKFPLRECVVCHSTVMVEYFERDVRLEDGSTRAVQEHEADPKTEGDSTAAKERLVGTSPVNSLYKQLNGFVPRHHQSGMETANDVIDVPHEDAANDTSGPRSGQVLATSLSGSSPASPYDVASFSGTPHSSSVPNNHVYTSLLPQDEIEPKEVGSEKSPSFMSSLKSAMLPKAFSPKRRSPTQGAGGSYTSSGKGSLETDSLSPSGGRKQQPYGGSTTASRTNSPYQGVVSDAIYINKDDFYKADHRLMLYFDMELFDDHDEEFFCLIQSEIVRFGVDERWNGILLMSTKHIFVIRLKQQQSDSPKEWVAKHDKYNYQDVRSFDVGYFKQNFQIELSRPVEKYKFIVKDSERCEKFLTAFLLAFEEALRTSVITKSLFPVICEEPNPRTVYNIRRQLFGIEEDLHEKGRRIFEQVNVYTYPSLIKSRKMRIRTHTQCFVSKEFVDWLMARREVDNREQAVSLCQSLLDVGVIFHVSKEERFAYSDAFYKFNLTEDNRKLKSVPTRENSHGGSLSDDDQARDFGRDANVCLYTACSTLIVGKDGVQLVPRAICMTRSHLILVDECHQWPLPRTIADAFVPRLPEITKCVAEHITNIAKFIFFEDKPNMFGISFIDEDNPSQELTWLLATETVRTLTRLTTAIKTVWEGKFEVELCSEVLPTSNLYLAS